MTLPSYTVSIRVKPVKEVSLEKKPLVKDGFVVLYLWAILAAPEVIISFIHWI